MKRLITTPITDTVGFPPKAGTWDFLQDAHKETVAEVLKAMIGGGYSASIPYALSGLARSSTAFTAGSIFYGGEVYMVDAFDSVTNGPNAHYIDTYQTGVDADPTTFTDQNDYNVHRIRKIGFNLDDSDPLFDITDVVRIGEPAYVSGSPTTIKFDYPKFYFRSLVANPASSLAVTLDATDAVSGCEVLWMFQSDGTTLEITNNISGFDSRMGIGGYTNPLSITVNNLRYFVVKYRAFVLRDRGIGAAPAVSNVSIELLENN